MSSLGLILGSGFSIPFGMPSTSGLTRGLLDSQIALRLDTFYTKNKWENTAILRRHGKAGYTDAYPYHKFIKYLYHREKTKFPNLNYEGIYSILVSLFEYQQNPVNYNYFQSILSDIESQCPEVFETDYPFEDPFFARCQHLIQDYVSEELCPSRVRLFDYKFLEDLIMSDRRINVFSLNHDTVFEDYCAMKSINLYDGFEITDRVLQEYKGNFLNDNHLNVLKLHGSINWFDVHYVGNNQAISQGNFYTKQPNGSVMEIGTSGVYCNEEFRIDARAFITGTNNKFKEYNLTLYSDLKYHFKRLMDICDELMVIGYSFNDYGITTEIIQWKFKNPTSKLIIIDPNMNNLCNHWAVDRLRKNFIDTVILVNKNFENLVD